MKRNSICTPSIKLRRTYKEGDEEKTEMLETTTGRVIFNQVTYLRVLVSSINC